MFASVYYALPRRCKQWGAQALPAFFLLYIFLWNWRTLNFNAVSRFFPTGVNWVGDMTRTDQKWGMFAPYPIKDDGWFIVPAKLADSKEIDLLKDGAPVSWKKPESIAATFPDPLWQKYLMNLWAASNAPHRAYYAAYLTRQWNENHDKGQRIRSLRIIYMREDTLPKGTAPVKMVILWQQRS